MPKRQANTIQMSPPQRNPFFKNFFERIETAVQGIEFLKNRNEAVQAQNSEHGFRRAGSARKRSEAYLEVRERRLRVEAAAGTQRSVDKKRRSAERRLTSMVPPAGIPVALRAP